MAEPQQRGRARLVANMVLENRPWRLVLGMRSALAAVLATSMYLVITSTIWQLATLLGITKLVGTVVVAIALMVVWIIGAHHLWEHPRDYSVREAALLHNTATVLSLLVGVVVMAAAVFVFNLVVTLYFLQPPIFTDAMGDHIRLAGLATGFATVGGALGSGLDSDTAVRRATYGGKQQREMSNA